MSNEKEKSKKKFIIPIILYIVLVLSVTVYTFAWFVSNQSVEIGVNKEIVISSDNKLEIMNLDAESAIWGNEIVLSNKEDTVCPDITGNGLEFYFPTYLIEGDKPNTSDPNSYKKLTQSNYSQYLITLRLKFRATEPVDVYLSQKSYVQPKNTEYTGENARKSAFGNFSADYIAGCSRVAFIEVKDGAEQLKTVWIPNDKFEVSYTDGTDNANFIADGNREESYGYHTVSDGKVQEITYSVKDYVDGKVMVGNANLATEATVSSAPNINSSTPLLSFAGGKVEEKEMIIRMWFEGTDREADKALAGGEVLYNFNFLGIDKADATQADTEKLQTVACREDGYLYFGNDTQTATGILYTTNGIDWIPYGGVGGVTFTESCTLYLKTAESSLSKSSSAYPLKIIK